MVSWDMFVAMMEDGYRDEKSRTTIGSSMTPVSGSNERAFEFAGLGLSTEERDGEVVVH
jgi:hypothetical protein